MDNPTFVDEEDIPMVHKDDDYDDYMTPDTSRMERHRLQYSMPQKQHRPYGYDKK